MHITYSELVSLIKSLVAVPCEVTEEDKIRVKALPIDGDLKDSILLSLSAPVE
jgi:hypothetical protein